ncbi:MAG: ThiF family adenylyltransferase [Mesorhizobium sp.]|uniref:ThiF family adenylyltransferase n=1 Tax=Mesorhizobium sp. TaxID=1871066 RepID=UPI00121354E3|nr:ThiF family adenylyltransferase [Mesorhizobium sp.]TIT00648.1 MAG: ThiF family adenylyltransferase [Mesorhizobium sp.]TKD47294.1 MAG: ThiF family adenylyltransferase [Mesorhizobium sp.]
MSHALFSLNPDLKQLRDEGYFVQQRGGYLVMREVPYVDAQRQLRIGTLISSLTLAGDRTRKPDTHVAHWDGDFPCHADGSPIQGIAHQTGAFDLGHGLKATHAFSSKPAEGYADYHHKMTSYANIIAGPAAVLNPGMTARTIREPEAEEDSVFNYVETASDRVGIGALAERLASERVAIIGVGGTGGYILDFVAKTPVREIRLFDSDEFLTHNAFRAPGAPSLEELREAPKKVEYLKDIYSRMHRNIVVHDVALGPDNLHLLDGVTFAFLSLDASDAKRLIVEKLEAIGAAFIDVGMGLELDEGSLGGILRVTASTPQKRDHLPQRISFVGGGVEDIYASNIQVADLNALNAVLAVVKWKKIRGFYRDLEHEHHCTYTTDGNMLINGDLTC